jgi:multidrug efflux pump subunit AcrB
VVAINFVHTAQAPSATNITEQVKDGFKHAVARIHPTLPKKVDDAITLTDVSSSGMILTYHYNVDTDNYELLSNFIQVAQRATTSLVCNTNPQSD